jgi:hypothetical protein
VEWETFQNWIDKARLFQTVNGAYAFIAHLPEWDKPSQGHARETTDDKFLS